MPFLVHPTEQIFTKSVNRATVEHVLALLGDDGHVVLVGLGVTVCYRPALVEGRTRSPAAGVIAATKTPTAAVSAVSSPNIIPGAARARIVYAATANVAHGATISAFHRSQGIGQSRRRSEIIAALLSFLGHLRIKQIPRLIIGSVQRRRELRKRR